jgi:plastocyanin
MRRRRVAARMLAVCLLALFLLVSAASAAVRLVTCPTSVSTHYPKQYSKVTAKARALDGSGRPIRGVNVVFAWYFKSGRVSDIRTTDVSGYAYSTRAVGRAPTTYRVVVRATGSSGQAARSSATWFIPRPSVQTDAQKVSVGIGPGGYMPSTVNVQAGRRISLTVARGVGCSAGFAIPKLGISADNSRGPATIGLPALQPGTYRFTCGMGMLTGYLVAK